MYALLWVLSVVLCLTVLFVTLLLLGALRNIAVLNWRLDQLEARTPRRVGRDGLPLGRKAPDFALQNVGGGTVRLSDFVGGEVMLVFLQAHCAPCEKVVPELNRLHRDGEPRVLAVNLGEAEAVRVWEDRLKPQFVHLVGQDRTLSRRYEVSVTPFAFLIDERGVIRSKGALKTPEHVRMLVSFAPDSPVAGVEHIETNRPEVANGQHVV